MYHFLLALPTCEPYAKVKLGYQEVNKIQVICFRTLFNKVDFVSMKLYCMKTKTTITLLLFILLAPDGLR